MAVIVVRVGCGGGVRRCGVERRGMGKLVSEGPVADYCMPLLFLL